MRNALLIVLIFFCGVVHAGQTPFAYSAPAHGHIIVLLEERCEVFTKTQQYIVINKDRVIVGGGCWQWDGQRSYVEMRDGRTLRPVQVPTTDLFMWSAK